MPNDLIIYQNESGAIELKGDFAQETIWANLQQIAELFSTDKSGVSRHLKNIYSSGELSPDATVAKFATVQKEGAREVERNIEYYNLDAIISVGYRVNSKKATSFRQWATKTLREHITQGYTINKSRIQSNFDQFMQAVNDVQSLLPTENKVQARDALELIKMFASTWLSLTAYDSAALPEKGATLKDVQVTFTELDQALQQLKQELLQKNEASEIFGTERSSEALAGIIGNIFQSFGDMDLYPSVEEKAAHLLYFIVKNHPFVDGNKRSGAYSFVWFLQKAKLLDPQLISPQALTTLTLLVAESSPQDKVKIIGLILLLLSRPNKI
jgi:prophage maintenance system killer protein